MRLRVTQTAKVPDRQSCRHSCGPRRQVTRMMPVSVPKVPYRTPKEGTWQWVDIWNCLVSLSRTASGTSKWLQLQGKGCLQPLPADESLLLA